MDVSLRGNASRADGDCVSGDFFSALAVPAAMGRTIERADDAPGAAPVIVLGYGYWQRQFGSDPSIIGNTIYLNRNPFVVVSVAAPQFFGLNAGLPADFWAPPREFDPNRHINWRLFWDYSGGNFYENMCHQLAIWYKVLNLRIPTAVTTVGGIYLWKDGREAPDTMSVNMQHPLFVPRTGPL